MQISRQVQISTPVSPRKSF